MKIKRKKDRGTSLGESRQNPEAGHVGVIQHLNIC
jgi:hypothetical protein